MMYAQDYDERYTGRVMWTNLLEPYIKNTQIFACPSWGGNAVRLTTKGYCQTQYGSYPMLFGLKGGYGVTCNTVGTAPGRMMGDVKSPANIMWLIEVGTNTSATSASGCTHHSNPDAACADGPVVAVRHNDGANFGFLDGHAKWQKVNDTGIWRDPVLAAQLRYSQ